MPVANSASSVGNYQGAPDWPQTWARTTDGGKNQTTFDANQLLAIVTDHTELVKRIRLYDLPLLQQDLAAKQVPWPYSSGAATSGVNAQNQPTLVAAHITAAGPPTSPLTVVTGTNDEFTWTGANGTPVVYTLAAGTYTGLSQIEAAVLAATASGNPFSLVAAVQDNGTDLVVTARADKGASGNGDTITPGTNDVSASLGFANPTTLAGGSSSAGVAVWVQVSVPTNTGGSRVVGGFWSPYTETTNE